LTTSLASQFRKGQPLVSDLRKGRNKAVRIGQRIIFCRAVVESENLFVNVTLKMVRFHSDVCAVESPLEQRPEVLQSVRMHLPVNVPLGVIHHVMHEAMMQVVIPDMLILTCPRKLVQRK